MPRPSPRPWNEELRLGPGSSARANAAGQRQVQPGGESLSWWPAPAVDADGPGVVQVLGSHLGWPGAPSRPTLALSSWVPVGVVGVVVACRSSDWHLTGFMVTPFLFP